MASAEPQAPQQREAEDSLLSEDQNQEASAGAGRRRPLPLRQRLQVLLYGLRGLKHRLPLPQKPLAGCRGTALAVQPHDAWPGDAARGRDFLQGKCRLAGRLIEDPSPLWRPEGAGERWLAALHGFSWLRDLRTAGGDACRRLSRDMTRDWLRHYGKRWDPLAWRPDVLAERLASWLGHYEYFAASAEPELQAAMIDSLGRQARFLQGTLPAGLCGGGLLAAVKALLLAGFSLPGGAPLKTRGEALLLAELSRQVALDGGHPERNPSQLAALLRDLIDLRALYSAAETQPPGELDAAIGKIAPLLNLLRHGDGGLALFNGSKEEEGWYLDLLLQRAAVRKPPFQAAPQAGFQRLQSGRALLLVEAGAPPPPGYDETAHAGALSFEMSVGRERLIVNCGSLPQHPRWAELLRGTAAHSTLSLDERNSSEVLSGGGLGERARKVACRREEAEGNVWLEMSHDGYAKRLGILHHRRLYLASGGEDLRGEDRVERLPGGSGSAANAERAVLRFHIHPEVRASLLQGGGVLLRLKRGGAWRFRQAGGAVSLEPSLYFGGGQPRHCEQIVVAAPLAGRDTTVKWSLKRE